MNELLLKILNIDASIPDDARTELVWSNLPSGVGFFVLLAGVILVGWLVFFVYKREQNSCSLFMRRTLAGLRCASGLVILMIFLDPVLKIYQDTIIEPVVVVLIDDSLSMGLPDRYDDDERMQQVMAATGWTEDQVRSKTRAEIVEQLLSKDNAALIEQLKTKGRLRVMTFGQDVVVRPLEGEDDDALKSAGSIPTGDPLPPLKLGAAEKATNIANAMRQSLKNESRGNSSPIAAVVVITDGQNNEGDEPAGVAETMARKYDTQVFTVGIGDKAKPLNLRISEVLAPPSAFKDDPMEIQVKVEGEELKGRSIPIELYIQKGMIGNVEPGTERLLESKRVSFDKQTGSVTLQFEHTPTESGNYVIKAKTPEGAIEGEAILVDNIQVASFEVLKNKARVLMIAGVPSWEYRMLQTLLTRDQQIDLSVWLQSHDLNMEPEGNTKISKLPRTVEELAEYDVILMLDPNPALEGFNDEDAEAWKEFLNRGGGMMYMTGPNYSSSFITWPGTQLKFAEIMPVDFGNVDASQMELLDVHSLPFPLKLTPDGQDDSLLHLDEEPLRNKAIWESLPPIYWTFPITGPNPGSTVLVEYGDPRKVTNQNGVMMGRPLLVSGQYGPGRVVYMGFNGTWRWRQAGEAYFDKFWIQMVRYLFQGNLVADQKRGRILLKREVFTVGSTVSVTAILSDERYDPYVTDEVIATVSDASGEPREIVLKPVPGEAGQYSGAFRAMGLGESRVEVMLPGANEPVMIDKRFKVELPQAEINDRRLNEVLIDAVAERGQGKEIQINELDTLVGQIPDQRRVQPVPSQSIKLWSQWFTLALLAVLLSVEWALRKANKLM